jgi:Pyridoxamine 5'-phosphate oxidase
LATWDEFARFEPEFARLVRARFDSHKHKMMATLRKDGSPRLSGIEATFSAGQLWLGMMPDSRKALDLRRDPRLALHSASVDPNMADGDAKLAGRAIEHTADDAKTAFANTMGETGQEMPEGPFHLFSVDIQEAVLIRLGDPADHLVIETWREGQGLSRVQRR